MLLDQIIKVKWNSANKKTYVDKGYTFTKMGDKFEVHINDLNVGSNEFIKYKCDYCGETYEKTYNGYLQSRKKINKDSCNNQLCKSKKISESHSSIKIPIGESLAEKFPDIVKEWDYIKNNGKTPENYKVNSNKKIWWKCKACSHEWYAQVSSRTNYNRGCPACASQVVSDINNLLVKFPEIAAEWHPTKNGELSPSNVTAGSGKRAWWKCKEGHEWDMTVSNRTANKCGCPYCRGRKASIENCLETLYPDVAKEWNYRMNGELTPKDVRSQSNKKVWWICSERHEWLSSIDKRTFRGSNCPTCSESKGERLVREFLTNNNMKFKAQYEFENLKGLGGGLLRFDFAVLNDMNLPEKLIEFDGIFHFKKIYKDDDHERIVIHDEMKNNYCKSNKIPLIRIKYTEMNRVQEILRKEFKVPVQ
jgi:hypothetical protein